MSEAPSDTRREAEAVVARVAALAAAMRTEGARLGVGEMLSAHRALAAVDPASPQDARRALRIVLCSGRDDLPRFERAFASVFGAPAAPSDSAHVEDLGAIERAALPRAADTGVTGPPREVAARRPVPAAWSELELLREKDFAQYSEAELQLARELIRRIARRGPTRMSRRMAPGPARSHVPDLRRVVRASLRTRGEPVQRHWRAPTRRPRPMVFICDVSGSMSPYARMLLQYMHAAVVARRRIEAFAFGTRLTRITHELSGRDHARALERSVAAVTDFSGGTRIGAALAELNRRHGRRLGRGAVVVILSDGWDRGEPELLATEMARLRRSAHRLVWLNPLAADRQYQPLTRGMRAATPYTDRLLAGNSLHSLEQLAEILEEM